MITDKQIEKCLEGFDFAQAASVYRLYQWKWFPLNEVPTEKDLRKEAKSLLKEIQKNFPLTKSVETGGLRAKLIEENYVGLELQFIANTSFA